MALQWTTIATVIAVVFVFTLVVMGAGAWFASQSAPPIPDQVVGPDGEAVGTDEQIRDGKRTFQRDGLMIHGSILGNGAYYRADSTADALDLSVQHTQSYYARERDETGYGALASERQAAVADVVRQDLDERYDGGAVEHSAAELCAHRQVRELSVERSHGGSYDRGVPAGMIEREADARQFADFALWTA